MIYKQEFNCHVLFSNNLSSNAKLLIYFLAINGTLYADENGNYNHLCCSFDLSFLTTKFHISDRQMYRLFDELKNFDSLKIEIHKHVIYKKKYCFYLYLLNSCGNESVGYELDE